MPRAGRHVLDAARFELTALRTDAIFPTASARDSQDINAARVHI